MVSSPYVAIAQSTETDDFFATAPLGEISATSLNATLDACGRSILFAHDTIPPTAVLEPVGWRAMTAEDATWFYAIETQSNAAWFAFSETASRGNLDADSLHQLWERAHALARADFQAQLDAGIIYRHKTDALLRLLSDRKECILLAGHSAAAIDVYDALPASIATTENSPFLNARMNQNAATDGGVFEGNVIVTAAMSELFQTDFQLAHVFLTTGKP